MHLQNLIISIFYRGDVLKEDLYMYHLLRDALFCDLATLPLFCVKLKYVSLTPIKYSILLAE
jgi:hypothetical protein